jgi:hypothetical protein
VPTNTGGTSFIATANGSLDPFHDPRSFGQKEPDPNDSKANFASGCISVAALRTLDPLDKSQTGIADQRGLTRRCRLQPHSPFAGCVLLALRARAQYFDTWSKFSRWQCNQSRLAKPLIAPGLLA